MSFANFITSAFKTAGKLINFVGEKAADSQIQKFKSMANRAGNSLQREFFLFKAFHTQLEVYRKRKDIKEREQGRLQDKAQIKQAEKDLKLFEEKIAEAEHYLAKCRRIFGDDFDEFDDIRGEMKALQDDLKNDELTQEQRQEINSQIAEKRKELMRCVRRVRKAQEGR